MSTPGENWIKLLRGYGPVAGNNATEAENVGAHTKLLGIERLSFRHPARKDLDACLLDVAPDQRPTIIITGTAGDGKTTICYEILEELAGVLPSSPEAIETFDLVDGGKLDLIRDLTGWRKRDSGNKLISEQVAKLEEIASHAINGVHRPTIIAVNDGQIHEVYRALPENASADLRRFFAEAIRLHSLGESASAILPNFRLFDLSATSSEVLMRACIDTILTRPEWKCLEEECEDPLFAPQSCFAANYRILSTSQIQERLFDIARLADACQFHLPIRAILMLLANVLLGHKDAPEGLLKPNSATRKLLKSDDQRQEGAFHLNLFGFNLGPIRRSKHNVYKFLASLQIGQETTNDIDELLIFGDRDDETKDLHATIVANDPYCQRSKELGHEIRKYICGDLADDSTLDAFLELLAHERRRVFIHADEKAIEENHLWCISAFHHAGRYIRDFLRPVRDGQTISGIHINSLITGLNRIWTGAYIANTEQEVFLASGLDMTTSPVSDILLETISKNFIKIEPSPRKLPRLDISHGTKKFSMLLTLMRFEFIQRAAEGAMPGSFSREACEDLMALKQRALRDLDIRENEDALVRICLGEGGKVQKTYVEFQ